MSECVRALCMCVTNYALNKFNSDFRLLTLRRLKQENVTTITASSEFEKREKMATTSTTNDSDTKQHSAKRCAAI